MARSKRIELLRCPARGVQTARRPHTPMSDALALFLARGRVQVLRPHYLLAFSAELKRYLHAISAKTERPRSGCPFGSIPARPCACPWTISSRLERRGGRGSAMLNPLRRSPGVGTCADYVGAGTPTAKRTKNIMRHSTLFDSWDSNAVPTTSTVFGYTVSRTGFLRVDRAIQCILSRGCRVQNRDSTKHDLGIQSPAGNATLLQLIPCIETCRGRLRRVLSDLLIRPSQWRANGPVAGGVSRFRAFVGMQGPGKRRVPRGPGQSYWSGATAPLEDAGGCHVHHRAQ
jgi:hypothetical protein